MKSMAFQVADAVCFYPYTILMSHICQFNSEPAFIPQVFSMDQSSEVPTKTLHVYN